MKISFAIVIFLLLSCSQKDEFKTEVSLENSSINNTEVNHQELQSTKSIDTIFKEALASAEGDLDEDGINEIVVINNTNQSNDEGTIRELIIYKIKDNKWIEWYKSTTAIMGDEAGGMAGDPFDDISIENNVLHISHWGGSSWSWGYVHKFRYQNKEMELIGVTSNFGKVCEEEEEFDFNVSIGQINYTKKVFSCNDEGDVKEEKVEKIKFNYMIEHQPTLKNFKPASTTILLVNKEKGIEKQFDF